MITNHHVIEDCKSVKVSFKGNEVDANADAYGTTTAVISASDRYEVAVDGSLILAVPADIEGLENCPLSTHPCDTVKLLFSADGAVQRIVKKAIKPACAG